MFLQMMQTCIKNLNKKSKIINLVLIKIFISIKQLTFRAEYLQRKKKKFLDSSLWKNFKETLLLLLYLIPSNDTNYGHYFEHVLH